MIPSIAAIMPVSIVKPFIGGLAIRGRRPMRTVALSHGTALSSFYGSPRTVRS
jgi:hypothetical protein